MNLPITTFLVFVAAACGADPIASRGPAGSGKADLPVGPDASEEQGMCAAFFGAPNHNSGTSADECGSACPCNGGFESPDYDEATIAALEAKVLSNPTPPLAGDPYDRPDHYRLDTESFCAVIMEPDNHYRLATFASLAEVKAAGGSVTHFGACGECSTLQDLAVYLRYRDLTAPVKVCGLKLRAEKKLECIAELGFTNNCAKVWFYNTKHTAAQCLGPCLRDLTSPYRYSNGELNECIACDEEESGEVFKAAAGRIRRNSGVPSAICRPCEEVAPVVHDYLDAP